MQHSLPAPVVGAIVWGHLPEQETLGRHKLRPLVILDVQEQHGLCYVLVAKGTSQHTDELYPGEFVVKADIQSGHCKKDTKFCLARRERLPYTRDWFEPSSRQECIPKECMTSFKRAAKEVDLI